MNLSNNLRVLLALHNAEEAIIERMAEIAGMTPAKMRHAIISIPELNAYYKGVRKEVIEETYGKNS